jgi:acyl-CoA synthetase (AMP-forming)/AMP-acid ligase II
VCSSDLSAVRQQFLETFERPLQDCYGLTELGGPLTSQTPADARIEENVGYPVAGLDLKLVPSPYGDDELWIRSPFAMQGYLTESGLESPFDEAGFMATGDLARIESGKPHITGRSKDTIVRGGINVAPIMVENHLGRIEGVEEVAVVGVPDDFWGETIVACVIPAPETDPQGLKERIFSYAGKTLDTNLRPDRVVTMESFPRASTGKVQKHSLRSYLTSHPAE